MKGIFIIVLICLGLNVANANIDPRQHRTCIQLSDKPSLIIKFRNKTSNLSKKNQLRRKELNQLSVDGIRFTHVKPMADGAFIVFFTVTTDKRSSLLKAQKPSCYSQESINLLMDAIKQRADIEYIIPNALLKLQEAFSRQKKITGIDFLTAGISSLQWNLLSPPGGIDAQIAWANTTTGSPYVVTAVIDTGILNNDSLNPNILPGVHFINQGAWGPGASPSCGPECLSYDHGTHVAGIIAASGLLAYGQQIFGVAPTSKVLPINIFTKVTSPLICGDEPVPCLKLAVADLINALAWLYGENFPGLPPSPAGVRVINLSLGAEAPCLVQRFFDPLLEKGQTIVAAAGNENIDASRLSPANCNGVIAVAATGSSGERAVFSNWGSRVNIAAPGGNVINPRPPLSRDAILSTVLDNYAYQKGTSQASPHVAGVVALLYSIDPTLNAARALEIIASTATPFPVVVPPGTDSCLDPNNPEKTCGAGIINAARATALAQALSPLPTLISAVRNPLNKTEAFIYFSEVNPTALSKTYTLLGASAAIVTLEEANHRFRVSNITNPKAFPASIQIVFANLMPALITNTIVIPGIV